MVGNSNPFVLHSFCHLWHLSKLIRDAFWAGQLDNGIQCLDVNVDENEDKDEPEIGRWHAKCCISLGSAHLVVFMHFNLFVTLRASGLGQGQGQRQRPEQGQERRAVPHLLYASRGFDLVDCSMIFPSGSCRPFVAMLHILDRIHSAKLCSPKCMQNIPTPAPASVPALVPVPFLVP